MRMNKTLLKLLDKAEDAGKANLNGRRRSYECGHCNIGKLESRYYARMYDDELELRHWGTTILVMNMETIKYAYAESKSDIDAIKTAIYYMTSSQEYEDVHYYPSTDKSFIGGKELTYGETVNIAL